MARWEERGWDYSRDCVPIWDGQTIIAHVLYLGGTEQAKKHARLIAAAPDLLSALKEAERLLSNSPATYEHDLPEIRAVIARAQGEEQ